jgi:NADH:ubiquinone oxidoreductase subunit 3 (subunit A)
MLFLTGGIILFFFVLLFFSKLIRPRHFDRVQPDQNSILWSKINVRYQILLGISVLLFLAVLILYPAAVVLRQQIADGSGLAAFLELSFFLGTLSVALAYAWKKGDLTYGDF